MSSVEYLGLAKPVNKIMPLVSVCIPTYQHAEYISECLDSVLSQKVSFPIEILIGEDQSTDGTREICIRYADQNPDKVRLFLNDRKDVIFIDERPSGRANFLNLYSEARGKFIAICEGDDYWTDELKLESQVAILRENQDCSLVFHNASIIVAGRHKTNFSSSLTEGFYGIESVIRKPWFVPTPSMLFRKNLLELGEWAKYVYNGDYTIQLMLAAKFPFYYVDRVMSAYRVHEAGTSRGRETLFHTIKLVETLSIFNCISGFKYDRLIKNKIDGTRSEMLENERKNILISTILNMSYWEKALTYRYYVYLIRHFLLFIRSKWRKLCSPKKRM